MDSDISISVVNNYKKVSFTDVEDAFREASVTSDVVFRRPEGPYAFLEWLIPAGAILIYSAKFLEKLAEKHAEHLDNLLAAGFRKLWSKAFGPKPPIDWQILD